MYQFKVFVLVFFLAGTLQSYGQDFWDIPTTEALIAHNKTNYSDHQTFRDNQLESQATVSFWKSTTNTFKKLSDSIDQRLTSFFILTSDLTIVYQIYTGLSETYSYQSRSMAIAAKYPFTLPVIITAEQQVYQAAYGLFEYLSLVVVSYGDISKMKVSSRQVIYQSIRDQIFILRTLCYSLYCSLQRIDFAQQLKNTVPYQFVNKDAGVVKDILNNLK